jgi:hypothetical protein
VSTSSGQDAGSYVGLPFVQTRNVEALMWSKETNVVKRNKRTEEVRHLNKNFRIRPIRMRSSEIGGFVHG